MDLVKTTLDVTHVERDHFLRKLLQPYVASDKIESYLQSTCVANRLDKEIVEKINKEIIQARCFYVGGASFSTSLFGSLTTALTLPFDCAQFAYHTLKLAQELYYFNGTSGMFTYQHKDELELLVYMLIGADGAISITASSLSIIGQKLYQYACKKIHLKTLAFVPIVGGVLHASANVYALHELAQEYLQRLSQMVEEEVATTPATVAKEIGTFIDVEYKEVEDKIKRFCNLEKLREYYQYVEAGYMSEEEFEQLKLDL